MCVDVAKAGETYPHFTISFDGTESTSSRCAKNCVVVKAACSQVTFYKTVVN